MIETPSSSPQRGMVPDPERSITDSPSRSGSTLLFPWKLHKMLSKCLALNEDKIVSWVSDGTAFKVHNVPVFVSEILPLYFKQTKYKSFQRQLNLWGFERVQSGPHKGAYHHKQFLRSRPNECSHLRRQRTKRVPRLDVVKTAKPTIVPNELSKVEKTPLISPRFSPMTRRVSEGSIDSDKAILARLDISSGNIIEPVDFEGVTFHPIEQDRYDELNLEFDFSRHPENQIRDGKECALLEELERSYRQIIFDF